MADAKPMTVDDLDMLDGVIRAYCQRHGTGGSLHIALDDGNCDRASIAFCQRVARENDDPVGEAIATLLLRAPDEVLVELGEAGWSFGYAVWLRLLSHG